MYLNIINACVVACFQIPVMPLFIQIVIFFDLEVNEVIEVYSSNKVSSLLFSYDDNTFTASFLSITASGKVLNEQQSPSSVIWEIFHVSVQKSYFLPIKPEAGIVPSNSCHDLQRSNVLSSHHMVQQDLQGSGGAGESNELFHITFVSHNLGCGFSLSFEFPPSSVCLTTEFV